MANNNFVTMDDGRYLGTFSTEELARLYGVQFGYTDKVIVVSPMPNIPDEDQIVLGPFQGEAEAPELPEAVAAPVAPPKVRTPRSAVQERVQAACDKILARMQQDPTAEYKRGPLLVEEGIPEADWTRAIKSLLEDGLVRQEGIKRGACYFLVQEEDAEVEPEETTEEDSEDSSDSEAMSFEADEVKEVPIDLDI